MGLIALYGIEVFGRIGVTAEERLVGRKFIIDVEIEAALNKPGQTDDISDTFNYELIALAVYRQLEKEFRLLEAAARFIAEDILNDNPDIRLMKIRIAKQSPIIKGNIRESMVEWHYPEDY